MQTAAANVSVSDRINRYIVECKYTRLWRGLARRSRINRYIVECKLDLKGDLDKIEIELIDT